METKELSLQTRLTCDAALAFGVALAQHRANLPDDCDRILELVRTNEASPVVLVEGAAPIRCGYRLASGQIVIFASFAKTELPVGEFLH